MKKLITMFFLAAFCIPFCAIGQTESDANDLKPVTYSKKDASTGVLVTTKITPRKPLEQEIPELEAALAEVRKNPVMVENGTVYKYEVVIAAKKKELAEIERQRAAKQKK